MTEFFAGARYLLRGFRLLRTPGLRRYVVVPLLVNTLLFGGVLLTGGRAFDRLMTTLMSFVPDWLQWLEWLVWPLFFAAAIVLVFFTFTLVANLLGAPFNGVLAGAVERHLCGTSAGLPEQQVLAGIMPALAGEARKLRYFLARALPLLLLFVVPVINAAAPLVWAIFGSWMLALEYLDYPLGNRGVHFLQQRALLRQRRALVLGFGAAIVTASLIPVLNFIVMPAAVAGATALYVDRLREPKRLQPA